MPTLSFPQRIVAAITKRLAAPVFGPSIRDARNEARWHFRGPLDPVLQDKRQVILAAWHQDVLPFFHYMANYTYLRRHRRPLMLSSVSYDGELTARLVSSINFQLVRGSHGKEGARAALRGQLRALRDGLDVVVIADGPIPPPGVLRPGPVYLARLSGVPLYVVRVWARPQQLITPTWFNMALPLPRCDIAVFSAGPIDVGGTVEEARARAEAEFHRIGEEVDAYLYLRPEVSGGVRWVERPAANSR